MLSGGCGNRIGEDLTSGSLFVTACGSGTALEQWRAAGDLVLLDWYGGTTPLYRDRDFAALDLAAFDTAGGGTLADDEDLFKEQVLREVTRILCDSPGPGVRVRHLEGADEPGATTVYFTQALSPTGIRVIGEGEYDPCNEQHDNAAVIFGEQIRRLGSAYTFEEWVRVFANVTAHEIAHTLGYGHVDRDEQWESGRSLFVELMLDGHTMNELRREQGFTVEQTNCPSDSNRFRRLDEYPTIICGVDVPE